MPALLERPKMTRTMYEALKRHIMNEREKIKQVQELDAMIERKRKEKELHKKKKEEEASTLEQMREQLVQLEKRLEQLRTNKHEVFLQLKKVLNQEDDTRRRTQIKEQSEMLSLQQQAAFSQHGLALPSAHPIILQASHLTNRPSLYKPVQMLQPMKRARSPSPTPSSTYQSSYHSDSKYPAYSTSKAGLPSHLYTQHAPPSDYKIGSYPSTQSGQVVYPTSSAHTFPQRQSQQPQSQPSVIAFQGAVGASAKYSGSQSAFSNYATARYPPHTPHPPMHHHQQQQQGASKGEAFGSTSYSLHRVPQPGFHGPSHVASIQHQLEQVQKSAFADDKYKQSAVRGVGGNQQGSLLSQALIQQQQQKQSKGSIVTGMSAQGGSNFQTPVPSSTHQTQPGSTDRPSYPSQPHRQYYQGH